ncbi:MAG: hypothetical protein IPI58_07110 [Alphaproteobacteria bacterium]|nr:MAG: hypothetical protein IPI58_07110 [Alphaproteobacteria bacterium]
MSYFEYSCGRRPHLAWTPVAQANKTKLAGERKRTLRDLESEFAQSVEFNGSIGFPQDILDMQGGHGGDCLYKAFRVLFVENLMALCSQGDKRARQVVIPIGKIVPAVSPQIRMPSVDFTITPEMVRNGRGLFGNDFAMSPEEALRMDGDSLHGCLKGMRAEREKLASKLIWMRSCALPHGHVYDRREEPSIARRPEYYSVGNSVEGLVYKPA